MTDPVAQGAGGPGGAARTFALTPAGLYVNLLSFLAAATLAGDLVLGPRYGAAWWQFATVVAVTVLAESQLLTIRNGATRFGMTFSEVAAILGLVLLPIGLAASATLVGVLISSLLWRRGLHKTQFNVASFTLGLFLAALVAGGPAQGGLDSSVLGWLRLFAAGVVFGAFTVTTSSVVVGLSTGRSPWTVLRSRLVLLAATSSCNAGLTVAIMALGTWTPAVFAVVPPMLGLVYLFYWISLRAQEETDLWRGLEAAASAVNDLDEEAVGRLAVEHAVTLFRADQAEIVVSMRGAGTDTRTWSSRRDGTVAPSSDLVSPAMIGTPESDQPYVLRLSGAVERTVVVAPLLSPKGAPDRLVLSFDGKVGLDTRERRVLGTYARTVAASLQRASLYDQTRTLAAVKAYEASHDHLTGLANRSLLRDRVEVELAEDDGRTTGLLLLDLDHFKSVNDTLGHTVGDRLLQVVGRRIVEAVGDLDVVARLGGDEFAVFLPDLDSPDDAMSTADLVLAALTEPVDVDGLRLSVGASIGVACHPHDARDVEELFQRADVAMYQAKGDRRSVRRYAASADESTVSHLELVAELRQGMARDEVVLHYQPQVDARTGRIIGVEALARWQHPLRGLLMPDAFIPPVEQSGLLHSFTQHVLDKSVADCAAWLRDGIEVTMAVNLSARNLLDRQLPGHVAAALARHALPAEQLILEITETTMVSRQAVVEEVLGDLRRLGVQISVDDFGTGYSSLALLQRVSVNELKIDRSFVADMLDSDNDAAIVRATIELAHSLNLRIVAEGVENAELLAALKILGCDLVQGWHLGRPCELTSATRLLRGEPVRPHLPAQRRCDSGFRVTLPA